MNEFICKRACDVLTIEAIDKVPNGKLIKFIKLNLIKHINTAH